MELYKNSQVVKNLLRKRDLLSQEDPTHKQIRSVLVICGGAMRGVYGAGAAVAFHDLGLSNVFDVVIGISTGAAIASYFLAGEKQTLIGASIYYDECLDGFISFRRWPIVDVDFIERVMRSGRKKLDMEAICKHRSQFFVGATDWENGKANFIDVKCAKPEPLAAIKASLAVTELYRKPVMVNGRNYTDGSTAMAFPAKKVLESFKPTDMLVIANCSREKAYESPSWTKKVLTNLLMLGLSSKVRTLAEKRSFLCAENLECIRDSAANIGILWGPSSIGRLTLNYQHLRSTMEEGKRETLKAFGKQ